MHGFLRLQEKIRKSRKGETVTPETNSELLRVTRPSIPRMVDHERTPEMDRAQIESADIATEVEITPAVHASLAPEPTELASNISGPDLAAVLTELGIAATSELGPPLVPARRHLEVASRLKSRGYRQLVSVVATHWVAGTTRKGKVPDEPEHFEVSYLLRTVGAGSRVATWAVRLAPGEPVSSLFQLFAGADWQEREQYDLVGVVFADHPDLRRLMMPENYDRHPLRRDLPANLPYAPWR